MQARLKVTLLWYRPLGFFIQMPTTKHKNNLIYKIKAVHEVYIKTRSPPVSLPFIGQVTEHTTVKWSIALSKDRVFNNYIILYHATKNTNNQNTGKPLYIQWYYIQLNHHSLHIFLCRFDCVAHCIFYVSLHTSLGHEARAYPGVSKPVVSSVRSWAH